MSKKPANGTLAKWIEDHLTYDGDDCLIWPFYRSQNGYARKGTVYVSRIICDRVYGPPPSERHEAAHSCGRGHLGCVHPKHLRWDTKAGNHADKILHGTSLRGERHNMVKLSKRDVERIISRLQNNELHQSIAHDFGVTFQTISDIKHGKTWGWFTGRIA